ncbi:MAG: hypothetical protein KGQ88_02270, partial [Chloroflexi bacterium]|nr:hypothetical protein [Chloroflexota bacterium]
FAGWLVGFPFTSAPVSLFLALEQGHAFAARAAVGSVAGVLAQTAFPLAYVGLRSRGWPASFAAGTLAFAVVGAAVRFIALPVVGLATVDVVVLLAALRVLPHTRDLAERSVAAPRWDLPSRAIAATALVVGLTEVAPLLGPFTSGILSGFPVYASVLAIFAHRTLGPGPAADVMRGLVAGLFGFAAFFLVVALALLPLGMLAAYALATIAVVAVQSVSLALLRRSA